MNTIETVEINKLLEERYLYEENIKNINKKILILKKKIIDKCNHKYIVEYTEVDKSLPFCKSCGKFMYEN